MKQKYQENCLSITRKLQSREAEILHVKTELEQVEQSNVLKSQELEKMKKQLECCANQLQIARDEYYNLHKEYKEIKQMLEDQIKKYRALTNDNICETTKNEYANLQEKLKEASFEIIELKDQLNKLTCDNNALKVAIGSLITNLERNIKGPSFTSLPGNSAESLAGEILNSLNTIEDIIVKNNSQCNCMSQISSQYAMEDTEVLIASQLPDCCKEFQGMLKDSVQPPSISSLKTSNSEDNNKLF
ncbi:hypothetical protein ABEB36_006315 [Hypothenemus hampei]|uniref:Uncharacterized protein n=1 Tax=Hypothenemus hampei TaxID=57062 RepID=A0ABD1EQ51_HYPHA